MLLFYGVQLNPGDAQAKDLPGAGHAHEGAEVLRDAGITDGVHKPFQIVVEGDYTPDQLEQVASQFDETEGIAGAAAPPSARRGGPRARRGVLDDRRLEQGDAGGDHRGCKDDVVPAAERELGGPQATLAGLPTSEWEFIDAVYGNFQYVLLFVVLLTYVLLMRAFKSVLLPLKAVILNLVSLGAAYGIIVFIFQKGTARRRSGTSPPPTRSSPGSR